MTTIEVPDRIRAQELATICGVSVRTARRWKADHSMPAGFALAVALSLDGDLGTVWPEWRGWSIRAGKLYTPEGWSITPGEIRALPIRYQLLAELQRQVGQPAQLRML